ncbi:hypothetical protein SLEP1_g45520 [Rubroshorea leprosula]|uniref:GDSL esterase/lipase n=1 Tax=Rubroshorea leprosula TaxID=152421 RepID=A0AAV5LJ79_9ROSI|nr:hypothetical protein SLEP1_g45520 [Rubroshorea leprosula]
MEKPSLFLFFPLLIFSIFSGRQQCVRGWTGNRHQPTGRSVSVFKPNKLFVFGDSYADTGNDNKSLVNSWSVPYGITFPGKPSGRFSDGRVSTDFIGTPLFHFLGDDMRFDGVELPLCNISVIVV